MTSIYDHLPSCYSRREDSSLKRLITGLNTALNRAGVDVTDYVEDSFSSTADGIGLSRAGENLGVSRPPGQRDAAYKVLIQTKTALARGTLYAIKAIFEAASGMTVVSIDDRQTDVTIGSYEIWLTVEDNARGRAAWVDFSAADGIFPISSYQTGMESGFAGPCLADNKYPYLQGMYNDYAWGLADVFTLQHVNDVKIAGTYLVLNPQEDLMIAAPSEPLADGADVYLKFQDGKGAGITLTDSSGNGRDITATTTVTRIANHPIAGKFLTTHSTSNLATSTFNVGPYYSLELLLEVASYVSAGDQICNYAVPPTATSPVFGIRVDSAGGVRYLAAGPSWTYFSTKIPLSTVVYLGLYREDAGSGQVTDSLWINGSLVETSAAFTPTNSASASHALMLIGGGWNKSHLRFWGDTRTDAQKKAAADTVMPWLRRTA